MKALEIKNLIKTYKGGEKALKGVSFDVEAGDFFALLGPNGAGKSTTINIVASLVNKTGGEVKIFGKDLVKDNNKVKMMIGLVPQEFNFNIFEKVEDIVINQAGYYGINRKEAKVRAEKYLKLLGLWKKKDVQGKALSGGMKRKLMIVRALLHQPKLIILDEPTAGVDVETRREMWGFFDDLNKSGVTVILTTHYLEEAEQMCKNIAIINNGYLIKNTSIKDLLSETEYTSYLLDLKTSIDKAPNLKSAKTKLVDDCTLNIDIKQGTKLKTIFQELDELGIEVTSMRNKSNRLEELFINLTKNDTKTN